MHDALKINATRDELLDTLSMDTSWNEKSSCILLAELLLMSIHGESWSISR